MESAAEFVARPRVSASPWFTVARGGGGGVGEETQAALLLLQDGGGEDAEDDDDQAAVLLLRVQEIEHLLGDVLRTLSRLGCKRGGLQEQIAAVSRGRGRHHRIHGQAAPAAAVAAPGGSSSSSEAPAAAAAYTRKGAGAVRKRLMRAAAGDVKKERERMEAVAGRLEEALADAKERLALQQMLAGRAAPA
uniref:Uncharacterized protein n=1 Tax=Oryza brachyantha TaxID=4533 RepID=J3MDG0_ORYBR